MHIFGRTKDVFRDRFTRLFARFYHGPVESVGKFNGYTSEEDVYWSSSDSAMLGQTTPVGTIILNKKRLEDLSSGTIEYVYQHEKGHADRRPLFKGIFWGMVFNGAIGITFLLRSLSYSLLIPFGLPAEPVALVAGISLLLILSTILTSWLEELAAELHAVRKIGEQEFLTAHKEISYKSNGSLRNRVLKTVLYPNRNTVIRSHRLICWLKSTLPSHGW